MSEISSPDGQFVIRLSGHTLEEEEKPMIVKRLLRVLMEIERGILATEAGDPLGAATAVVDIFYQLSEIKKELED